MLKLCVPAMALCALALPAQAAESPWDPHPQKGDVIVSMPCNAKMVFVKVYTSAGTERIRDQNFNAGLRDSPSPFAQNPNSAFIQGAFEDKQGFYYLMGKYEVSVRQYQSLQGQDKCPAGEPLKKDQLPVTSISWFDAMEAARNYSNYLQKAKDNPAQGAAKAFARLPTDAEWEFAARGGLKVSRSEFEGQLPPMEGELRDYAWYQGPQSANGRLQLPGRLKPNPLGLYDMLGNAQEMVLDPFRATRTGRLHGQAGGMTVRGGGFLTPKDQLTTALRTEKPLFSAQGELKAKDLGFRLVLGTVVAGSSAEVKNLNEEIAKLGTSDTTGSAEGKANANTVDSVSELIKKNKAAMDQVLKQKDSLEKNNELLQKNNADLTESLEKLKEQMVSANAERDEMRDVAVVANLRLGGFLCKTMTDEQTAVSYLEKNSEALKKRCDENAGSCKVYENLKKNLEGHTKALSLLATYYGDTLSEAWHTYDFKLFEQALKPSKTAVSNTNLGDFIDVYYGHLKGFKKQGTDTDKNRKLWIKQCHALVE